MSSYLHPIRWGIIGCGAVTEEKSGPAYQHVDGFVLKAVTRRNLDKAKDYAKRHHVELVFDNADSLINSPEIDAVYIATPPDSHKQFALKVAAAGKPCCVEKPMATGYKDCLDIVTAFEQKQLPIFVAYYRRSLPRFHKIQEWLHQQAIGEVRHVRWCLNKPASEWDKTGHPNWRTQAMVAPGGYFDDVASHGLDLITYLLGPVASACGVSTNQQRLYTSKDAVSGCWIHDNNVTGSGCWNFGCHTREDTVEIFGRDGKLVFSVFADTALALYTRDGIKEIVIDNPNPIQHCHVTNMRDALLRGKAHPSTGQTATHTAWVMDQILGRN